MNRRKFQILTASVAIGLLTVLSVIPGNADVTGSVISHIAIEPAGGSTELPPLRFDPSTALNVKLSTSGLNTSLHSHWGLAGVEDVLITARATLGAVTLASETVFGRFSGACRKNTDTDETCETLKNDPVPTSDELLVLKERITTRLSLGGFQLRHLSMVEDVAFPQVVSSQTHSASMQRFGFGSVVTLEGETPSGVSILARTGICAARSPNTIKHHAFPFEVNPDCVNEGTAKPNLLFDFEELVVEDIPVAPNVTAHGEVVCARSTACTVDTRIELTGQLPVEFSVPIRVADALELSLGESVVSFSQGPAAMALTITPVGTLGMVEFAFSSKLDSRSSPADLSGHIAAVPGNGLADAGLQLRIRRDVFELRMTAKFSDGLPATFSKLLVDLATTVGSLELSSNVALGLAGLERSRVSLALHF